MPRAFRSECRPVCGVDACNLSNKARCGQEYAAHRGNAEESNYNLGRAAHHLGLVHIAVQYYKSCLHCDDTLGSEAPLGRLPCPQQGLKREAAFNLSLIYRSTGAEHLARQLLRQYVSI